MGEESEFTREKIIMQIIMQILIISRTFFRQAAEASSTRGGT